MLARHICMRYVKLAYSCDQKWKSFDETKRGGYCQQCQKEVIDYTNMSLGDVLMAIRNRPGGCGRFAIEHTDPNIITEIRIPRPLFSWAASLSLLVGIGNTSAIAQAETKTEQAIVSPSPLNIPVDHNNPQRICPKSTNTYNSAETVHKSRRPKRRLYISRRFPFVHYRRPRMGKFKPMGCPKF